MSSTHSQHTVQVYNTGQPQQVPTIMPSGQSKYGTAQRIAFAGLVISSIMITIGIVAPYWQTGSLSLNTFTKFIGEKVPFIGDYKFFKVFGGIWWYCAEVHTPLESEQECRFYPLSNDDTSNGRDWVIRITSVVCLVLTFLCSFVALCRTCCCGGGKTICHGIMAFLGGASGIVAAAVFGATVSDGFAMKLDFLKFGWAFYVFAAGAGLVTLVSFLLCFAAPENPLTPIIVGNLGQNSSQYVRLQEPGVQMYPPGSGFQPAGHMPPPGVRIETAHGPGY